MSINRYIIILSLFLPALLLSQSLNADTVYKKVNQDGSVEYSDQPFAGASELKLEQHKGQSTLPAYTPSQLSSSSLSKKKTNNVVNIEVLSPKHGDTIRNNEGNLTIMVQKFGKNKNTYKTQILINDSPIGNLTQATVIKLKNLDRGEIKIKAQLISRSGKILATSTESVVYLHRMSVIRTN